MLKAFEKIMEVGMKYHLNQHQMPEMIAVISDMQFDSAVSKRRAEYPTFCQLGGRVGDFFRRLSETTNHSNIRPLDDYATSHQMVSDAYREAGKIACGTEWNLPLTLYWNVADGVHCYPVQANTPNTVMLSGYNFHTLKLIVSGGSTDEIQKAHMTAASSSNPVDTGKEEVNSMEIFEKAMNDERYDRVRNVVAGPLSIELNMDFEYIPNKEVLVKQLQQMDMLL